MSRRVMLGSAEAAILAVLALVPLICLAGKEFVMPTHRPARSYPAHDEHPTEMVAIAADPYDMADKASIFTVHYSELGFLPIFLVVTNDGDHPLQLAGMQAQLVTVDRSKIAPATEDDIDR